VDDDHVSLRITHGGTFTFGGIPFNVVTPEKSATGRNVVQLQGGPDRTFARTKMPMKVEAPVGGFKANRLHFLGGIGGWAYPFDKGDMVVLKASVRFTDGTTETINLRNGVEIADHIARRDVPGSQYAPGVSEGFQVRWFSKQLSKAAPIEKIILESTGTIVAPTVLAITAELADPNAPPLPAVAAAPASPAPAAGEDANFKPQFSDPVPQPPASAKGPRVLIVGGGSSHDFVKFFGASDKATLAPVVGWVDFTQNLNGIAPILKNVDVLVLSANQPISSSTCKALIEYANRGGGIVALHPGTWYAWNNFPQWNKEIVGGGTRGHDALGPYPVKVTNPTHPITKGVPAEFEITDELYNYKADPAAAPIEVLATATSPKSGNTFPQVFVVKHPKARIVGITLGHDARAHDLPAYQTLLKNAVHWVSGH
jgi:type 1 glutamine amidotransferase